MYTRLQLGIIKIRTPTFHLTNDFGSMDPHQSRAGIWSFLPERCAFYYRFPSASGLAEHMRKGPHSHECIHHLTKMKLKRLKQ